ncbi:Hydrolase [Rhizoctonia solani]|uniref:Ubiquitin carboxyl-terminal hydrolase n=1 Tax=Rhizoctonia solani TaxID=456999 RepID=A0A8H7M789_9AGAM|nr:Hydrolase [Rhizoctonia solani]
MAQTKGQCPHFAQLIALQPPRLSQAVHREECTQCFDSQDSPDGIDVCLHCFNGGCLGEERHHARTHAEKTGHVWSLNFRRTPKPKSQRGDSEPPLKRLAIVEEHDADNYDTVATLRCWACNSFADPEVAPRVIPLTNGVAASLSSARQSEVKAWEEELEPCEHTLTLDQSTATGAPPGAHCSHCDLKDNLWLCLTCGSLGCGRAQYGGTGGNGHGLEHWRSTQHPVSVKVGTITPRERQSRIDPELALHLKKVGIDVLTQTKTEKSMTELQIEQNFTFEFSMTGEDGKLLQPVFGPGLTGLQNLGNSCYMASVLQTLFALPSFKGYYGATSANATTEHGLVCSAGLPADCLECQMRKIADGLCSGRYSRASALNTIQNENNAEDTVRFQDGLRPASFKALVGKGHREFATMRQQDAEEFLEHLFASLRSANQGTPPMSSVRYRVDEHDSIGVPIPAKEVKPAGEGTKAEYESVQLVDCLDTVAGEEALEYSCPSCDKKVIAIKQTYEIRYFSGCLCGTREEVSASKLGATQTRDDSITLDKYLGTGMQLDEEALPDDKPVASSLPEFNADAMEQLMSMGFPEIRCKRALLATGNTHAAVAMEWLFLHLEDPDIDDPLPGGGATPAPTQPNLEQVSTIVDMGFTPAQAKKALRESNGNPEQAVEWLFSHPDDVGDTDEAIPATTEAATSQPKVGGVNTLPARYHLKAFISHKGPSVHSGHYVAHIRTETEGWVLYNDEKVVRADSESVAALKPLAYLYVFEKI